MEQNKNDFWYEDLNDTAKSMPNAPEKPAAVPPQETTPPPTDARQTPAIPPQKAPQEPNRDNTEAQDKKSTKPDLKEKSEAIPEEKEKKPVSADPSKSYSYDEPHNDTQMVAVIRAYFAKINEKNKDTVTKKDYAVAEGDTRDTIVSKNKGVKKAELPKTLVPGKTISLRVHEVQKEIFFEKINSAVIGAKVYIVVETSGLKDAELAVKVLGSNNITFVSPDEQVKVLVQEEEKTTINIQVGNYASKKEYINASGLVNKAIAEVKLRPKDDKERKDWGEKIYSSEEKKAYFHLEVTAITDKKVLYCNEGAKEPDKETCFAEKGIFLNKEELWFRLNGCFCNRDIEVEELKSIIKEMRESEGLKNYAIFTASNCTLDASDKTYERLTEELNKACKKYEINTCIRKIHFLAQTYWEGDRYKTTLEYSSGEYLNPSKRNDAKGNGNTEEGDGPRYKGRGVMQLTWRNAYKEYFDHIVATDPSPVENKTTEQLLDRSESFEEKYYYTETEKVVSKGKEAYKKVSKNKIYKVDSAALVAGKLFFALDSAGWFWRDYKKSKAGNNLNYYADYGDTYVDFISRLVNGGANGKAERKIYYERLRDNVFDIKNQCVHYEDIKKINDGSKK